jgi:photosystem I P700 chlorophyll a apoprotein A1
VASSGLYQFSFQLLCTAIGALVMAGLMLFAGGSTTTRAPKLEWFQNVESMMNHHLAGLFGLGSLAWAGHQIHVSLPINKLLDSGVAIKDIPLPHEFILDKSLMAICSRALLKGLALLYPELGSLLGFLHLQRWLEPGNGWRLWLSDIAHHHVAIAVMFIVAGHMYRTNWGIGHSIKEILEGQKGDPLLFPGKGGHDGLYEFLTTSWHAQLAINLAIGGSVTIIVAQHMYAMPPYPYMATDYTPRSWVCLPTICGLADS